MSATETLGSLKLIMPVVWVRSSRINRPTELTTQQPTFKEILSQYKAPSLDSWLSQLPQMNERLARIGYKIQARRNEPYSRFSRVGDCVYSKIFCIPCEQPWMLSQ